MVRQQLWLINSSLLGLLVCAGIIVLLTQQKLPRWTPIEPTTLERPTRQVLPELAVSKIYENDLFNTYQRPTPSDTKKQTEGEIPAPPTPLGPPPFEPPQPKFLEPLPLAVKGIIVVGDAQNNRVLIENTKTKEERMYKIGDRIDDGQLIRIFRNRVIMIRANGQEEVLYLRDKDAKLDLGAQTPERWTFVIKKTGPASYSVDPHGFALLVPSLADLVQQLDPITVYQKGKPIGLRLGMMDPASVGPELGLQQRDIVTSIAGIPATEPRLRIAAYRKISSLPLGSVFALSLIRQGQPLNIAIKLEELGHPVVTLGAQKQMDRPIKTFEDIEAEKRTVFERRTKLAPTLQEIRKREKQSVLRKIKSKEMKRAREARSVRGDL